MQIIQAQKGEDVIGALLLCGLDPCFGILPPRADHGLAFGVELYAVHA